MSQFDTGHILSPCLLTIPLTIKAASLYCIYIHVNTHTYIYTQNIASVCLTFVEYVVTVDLWYVQLLPKIKVLSPRVVLREE